MNTASGKSTWIAVAVAAVIAVVWVSFGDSGMSAAGWIAMGLGILATLGLGAALMALVFISSRRGYDEPGNWR